MTRELIWIYSLCFGSYDKEPKTLRGVITKNKRSLVLLGINFVIDRHAHPVDTRLEDQAASRFIGATRQMLFRVRFLHEET